MEIPFPAYRGSEPFVFVCYAHEDSGVVYPELERLDHLGVNVWYDEGILPGQEWTQELADAIDGAAMVLYYVSPSSAASRNCRNEIQFAVDQGKALVSIYLESTELSGGLRLSIGLTQAIMKYELSEADYQRKLTDTLLTPSATGVIQTEVSSASTRIKPRHIASAFGVAVTVAIGVWLVQHSEFPVERMGVPGGTPPERSVFIEAFSAIGTSRQAAELAQSLPIELLARLTSYQEIQTVAQISRDDDSVNPAYRIQGNVVQDGNQLRVRVQLIRMHDQESVWSDESLADVGLVDLATTLAKFLRLEIRRDNECEIGSRKARSQQVIDLICRQLALKYSVNQRGARHDPQLSLALAEKVVELDPDLAQGHSMMAMAYLSLFVSERVLTRLEALELSMPAIERALTLDSEDPMLMFNRGFLNLRLGVSVKSAKGDYLRALAMDPLHPERRFIHAALGELSVLQGDLTSALEHYGRAVGQYDADGRILAEYALLLFQAEKFRNAVAQADAAIAILPEGYQLFMALYYKVRSLRRLGEVAEANFVVTNTIEKGDLPILSRAMLLEAVGRIDAAKHHAELASASTHVPSALAEAYRIIGDESQTLNYLELALDEGWNIFLPWVLRFDPKYSNLRSDPRWKGLMERLRLRSES